jgi:hypothetical protein
MKMWKLSEGIYHFMVGSSSRDIRIDLKTNVVACSDKTFDVLKCQIPFNSLTR